LEKHFDSLQKLKTELSFDLTFAILNIHQREMGKKSKKSYMNIHGSIILNNQKMEIIHTSLN
jgi:hypothetical protein